MAQSQCRRSVGDNFWPVVVVKNKESLNNRSNNPNKSGAVTLSELFKEFDQVLSKNRRMSIRWPPIQSEAIFRKTQKYSFSKCLLRHDVVRVFVSFCVLVFVRAILSWCP